jgi:pilus assembly protein CpaC
MNMKSRSPRLLAFLPLLLAGALALAGVAAGSPARAQDDARELVVGVGKSQVIELPGPYADVMVADPKIADVMPLNTRSIYVVGKAMGATSINIYGPAKHTLAAYNVQVSPDIESFKARLHEILPSERDVAVRSANQSIVLSGVVSSPVVLNQIMTLADTYAPGKVVNMMGVEGSQQVMLSVRFVEMERTTAKNLRVNMQTMPTMGSFRFTTGDSLINNAGSVLDSFGNIAALIRSGSGNLEILLDALETKGLVKTLAQPNLVAMSGETASFLAGGEFPIPVATNPSGAISTITVDFKQFGIALAFTPTILSDGLVNLVVAPEVSNIDPETSVVITGLRIPGLKVRRTKTTIELRDGESFTIAGLLSDNYQNTIRQYPFVGDVPVLGALFRSTGFRHDETELVVVVTPHLVTPHRSAASTPADSFVPPSDFELFLLGGLSGSASKLTAEDRALMASDPTRGGVDGPHGHVIN